MPGLYDMCHTISMKKYPLSHNAFSHLARYGLHGFQFNRAQQLTLSPGEYLSHAGEPMDALYFVLSGKAKVFICLSDGKELLLSYFTRQGIIGDIELVTNNITLQTTVQAVTEMTCIALPFAFYAAELKQNTAFINYIAKALAEKLAQRVVNSAITTLLPMEVRLCAYISQGAAGDGDVFCEKLTEVAAVMGVSYRHLLRCIATLCKKGIIEKTPAGYRITNRAALEKDVLAWNLNATPM